MAEQNTRISMRARLHPDLWSAGAAAIAILVLMPIASLVWIAFHPVQNIWPHLISTTLPRYLANTFVLAGSVAAIAVTVGTLAAWMVTMYRFPGSRWLEWLLLLPLAIPAYVGAYALVDFLEYAGPVQTALRGQFGWHGARDYWFPEIRSRAAATVGLAAALYPYVFLLARAGFRDQSPRSFEVARALGAGPVRRFLAVGLPLARPAIAAGAAIVMMETVNDFGVVDYFAVQTLTTGIFSTWLQSGNAGGAAQIAMVILVLIFLLAALEKIGRRNSRFHRMPGRQRPVAPIRLSGWHGWAATALCSVPFGVGFVLPGGVILAHALANSGHWVDADLGLALVHTIVVGGAAATASVLAALFMVYGVRLARRGAAARHLLPLTTIGYAAPGAVLGVGLLIPMAAADNALADLVERLFSVDIGLVMTGSAFAIVYAYAVRFFAIAQGAVDAAMGRVSPSLPMAARSLGRTAGGTLRAVYYPLIRGSVGTALLLVFVDCVKELPATLLLRPFNYDTLATRVYEKASLEQIGQAAPAAILVSGVGLVAVALLARANR